jgi:energy-coupling factor transport system ATP-binding protein
MPVVELETIAFSYSRGPRALESVDLSIESGASVAILGQNGAGKTTLLKMVNGLLRPDEGVARLDGEDIRDTSTARLARQVGFVFQDPRTQIFLSSVEAEVTFGPKKIGMSQEQIEARLEYALELTGLSSHRDSHPYDLAAADRKLLAIASILSMDPRILILDEPTASLDMAATEIVVRIVDACLSAGKTVIAATHDMGFAARCFGRAVILHKGHVVADGPTHQIFSQHDRLADTALEPTAISELAAACGLPKTLLTVPEMATFLINISSQPADTTASDPRSL